MKYAALMFDIVESRRYQDRFDIQNIMMSAVHYLNALYRESIKKNVVSSAGDEFQGLFLNLSSAFLYIRKMQLLVYPIKIRCGIGFGEIKYDVENWSSPSFDGEAYYLAREAITQISKCKDNAICFHTQSQFDKYLNMLCFSNAEIKSHQSRVARWIELLTDIILPLRQATEDPSFYESISDTRQKIIDAEPWNKVYGKAKDIESFHTDFGVLFQKSNEFTVKKNQRNTLFVDEFWTYGMTTVLSQALDASRQNLDRYITLGKIKESRTMDKAIYELLEEEIWQAF